MIRLLMMQFIVMIAMILPMKMALSDVSWADNPAYKDLSNEEGGNKRSYALDKMLNINDVYENQKFTIAGESERRYAANVAATKALAEKQPPKKEESFWSKIGLGIFDNQDTGKEKPLPKPGQIIGTYGAIKLLYDIPLKTTVNANEVRLFGSSQGNANIFSGDVTFTGLPSIAISVGYDYKGFYRGELEMGLIPLMVKNVSSNTDQTASPGSDISFDTSDMRLFILNVSTNHFLETGIFNDEYTIFVGGGIGIGYVSPYKSHYVTSAIIIPTLQLFAGCNLALTQRSKLSITWRMFYATFSLTNKAPFHDQNNILSDQRPIDNGSAIDFKNFITNAIGIDYLFYP